MHTLVVGGGWAGLAAAIELSRHEIPVTLLESARQLGGRARSVRHGELRVDNGQHLMIGAYHEILNLLDIMGVEENTVFKRQPLHLIMKKPGAHGSNSGDVSINMPALPAPLHLIYALVNASGLRISDRWQALKLCLMLAIKGFQAKDDISVEALLLQHGQSEQLIEAIWHPLCLAIMNTAPQDASAEIFVKTMLDSFARHRKDSDLLFARSNLGSVIPDPALAFIEKHGGNIKLGHRVTSLLVDGDTVSGVELSNGEQLHAGHVILAVPAVTCQKLLAPHKPLQGIADALGKIEHAPICTVYLQYPPQTQLAGPMVGLLDSTAQWVFDHALNSQPGLMAVVISGNGPHLALTNQALIERVTGELAIIFPDWPAPHDSLVIREKRATFVCSPGINKLRPAIFTPVKACLLAGDFTSTTYPATLEGAVRSGLECARAIIATQQ